MKGLDQEFTRRGAGPDAAHAFHRFYARVSASAVQQLQLIYEFRFKCELEVLQEQLREQENTSTTRLRAQEEK